MGTRGTYGFRSGGEDYLVFHQADSYPSGLGLAICRGFKKMFKGDYEKTKKFFQEHLPNIVDEGRDEHIYHYSYYDNIINTFTATKYSRENDYIRDISCECGYILNLDTEKLEVYCGCSPLGAAVGRYAGQPLKNGYGKWDACSLVLEIDFKTVLKTKSKELVSMMEGVMKDDDDT